MLSVIVVLAGCAFRSVWTQDANCDFHQDVVAGKTYYVYSPQYPGNYTPGIQCRWIARCPAKHNCRLDFTEINMPYTKNCAQDRLLISKTGDSQLNSAERYCGLGSLTAVSKERAISVGLIVSSRSSGGKFMARLTAQKATTPDDNCSCGFKRSNRIVGGEETGVNEYPMMAGLVFRDVDNRIKCGAVIISPRGVLTAAHCIRGRSASDVAVIVGEHNVTYGDSPATQGFLAVSLLSHPQYDPNTNDYDIGIVTTGKEIEFSNRVGMVCLPFKFGSINFAGRTVTALGWGTTNFGYPDSDVLMKVDLEVITPDECRQKNAQFLSDRQICTYSRGKDSCQDDSGGPLLYLDSATGLLFGLGVISYGRGCASPNYAGVNTRVSALTDWIVSNHPYDYCYK